MKIIVVFFLTGPKKPRTPKVEENAEIEEKQSEP